MTPEELEELRAMVGRLGANAYDENLAAILGAALEHIDQQAASLDEAEALIRKNADMINGYLARIAKLDAQVAALREIAVEQKAAHIAFVGFHRNMNEDETKHKAQYEARRQLAKEHPEAFR